MEDKDKPSVAMMENSPSNDQGAHTDEDDHDKGHHHVHFSKDTDEMGNTLIVVKEKDKATFEAHVGFLQVLHRYDIKVVVPVPDASEGYQTGETQGVYCRVDTLKAVEGGLEVSLNLLAHKEKLLRETIILQKPSHGNLKLVILARVLGKRKGTPMLREGITCVGMEHDDESEASDWQGFA